jgi:hypothetical protein
MGINGRRLIFAGDRKKIGKFSSFQSNNVGREVVVDIKKGLLAPYSIPTLHDSNQKGYIRHRPIARAY